MTQAWFHGISLLVFVMLYLIDVSISINSLVTDTFGREGR